MIIAPRGFGAHDSVGVTVKICANRRLQPNMYPKTLPHNTLGEGLLNEYTYRSQGIHRILSLDEPGDCVNAQGNGRVKCRGAGLVKAKAGIVSTHF